MREIAVILNAGDCLAAARTIREMPEEHLGHVHSPKVLRRAANLLRAGAYSATVAANRLDARARHLDETRTPIECIGEATRWAR